MMVCLALWRADMNLVSIMVTMSIAGAAAPAISQMAITPYVAQLQSLNFTTAESHAVTVAAKAEATGALPQLPPGCAVPTPEDSIYQVTCTAGNGRFAAVATRSFRIIDEINDGGSGGRTFQYETPESFSNIQCPVGDEWGVNQENAKRAALGQNACKPWVLWSSYAYRDSHPNSWLFDVNNHNGWGEHEDY